MAGLVNPQQALESTPAQVGGRLSSFVGAWENITSDRFTLSVIRNGYHLRFAGDTGPPTLSRRPVFFPLRGRGSAQALQEQVQVLLQKGAVEEVQDLDSPGFYSRLFLVPKRDGGWRPVIDLSNLNKFLETEAFKMETTASIIAALRPGEWTTSIDLKDAYFHIPIAQTSKKYLRFAVDGKAYQFVALPFGLAPAPFVFTKVMAAVASFAHLKGVRVHMYLDDWLLRALCRLELQRHTSWLFRLCLSLGLIVNIPKSNFEPLTDFVFLGIRFQTIPFLCRPSMDRWKRLLGLLQRFLKSKALTARMWMRLIGTMTSMDTQVPLGRLFRRPLQLSFRARWNRRRQSLTQLIPIESQDRIHLLWWTNPSNVMKGLSMRPFNTTITLFTDASKEGWGAHTDDHTASGLWPEELKPLPINWLELEAIRRALWSFKSMLIGQHVLVMCDNKTAVAYINKLGGTRSRRLYNLVRTILLWCQAYKIRVLARHIPGILNVKADMLSRRSQVIGSEWSLNPKVVSIIFQKWGQPHIDLFATRDNYKIPTFVSPFPDPMAWGTDALAMSWAGLWAYAFPPIQLLPKVLRKIREEQVEIILVSPFWPAKTWTTELLELCLEPPLKLPVLKTLLVQPRSSIFHDKPETMCLHAWRLSQKALDKKGFPQEWLRGWLGVNFDHPL